MPGEFDDLDVYKEARRLRAALFDLARRLPQDERFVLCMQMRRAALSVTNNIAEGHGNRSFRHNIAYLYRSRGSVNEVLDDLSACEDAGYFGGADLQPLRAQAMSVVRLINGYIAYLRNRLQASPEKSPARASTRPKRGGSPPMNR